MSLITYLVKRCGSLTLCLGSSLGLLSGATVISYTERDLGENLFVDDYVIENGFDPFTQSGFNLFEVTFKFPLPANVLAVPAGWDFVQNSSALDVFSTNSGNSPLGTDIGPGQALSGFSFLFIGRVGPVNFTASFSDPTRGGEPFVQNGATVMTNVPEPCNLAALGFAASLMVVVSGRVKAQRQRSKKLQIA